MRVLSGGELLGRSRHHNELPAPGSKLRIICDMFYPPLTVVSRRQMQAAIVGGGKMQVYTHIARLRDYYGMDIRQHHRGHWWLVGEWFPGGKYLDYADESYKTLGRPK